MDLPYKVYTPDGSLVLQAAEGCRYKKEAELSLLEAGYTIRLHKRLVTRKEIRGRN